MMTKTLYTAIMFAMLSACCIAENATNALIHLAESQPQGTNDYRKFHAYSAKTANPASLPDYDLSCAIHMWDGEWNRRYSTRVDDKVSVYHNPNSVIWDDLIGTNTLVLTSDSIGFADDALHLGYKDNNADNPVRRTDGIAIGCYDYNISDLDKTLNNYFNEHAVNSQILSVEICFSLEPLSDGGLLELDESSYPPPEDFPDRQIIMSLTGGQYKNISTMKDGVTYNLSSFYDPLSIHLDRYYPYDRGYSYTNTLYLGKTDTFGYDETNGYFRTDRTMNLRTESGRYVHVWNYKKQRWELETFCTATFNYHIISPGYGKYYCTSDDVARGCWQFPGIGDSGYELSRLAGADSMLLTIFNKTFEKSATATNTYTAATDISNVPGAYYADIKDFQYDSYTEWLDNNRTKIGGYCSTAKGENHLFHGKIYSVRVYKTSNQRLEQEVDKETGEVKSTIFHILDSEIRKQLYDRHRRNAEIDYYRFFYPKYKDAF